MDIFEKLKYLCLSTLCILALAGCSGLFGEKENGEENDLSVEEICEKIDGIFNDLESYLETEFNSDYSDKNAVMTAVKEWLASEEYVSNIEMEGDSCIVVTFPDGQKSSIEYPAAIDGNVSSYPDSLFTQDFLQDIPELTGEGTSTPSGPVTKASSTSDKALFNKLFFVLWEPFKNEGISDELFVDYFMGMKNIYYKKKKIYKNNECTIKSLRDIGGLYSVPLNDSTVAKWTPSVIVIATHGQGGKIIQTVYNDADYITLCDWWYEKKHEKDFNKIRSLVFSEEKIGSGKKTRISYRLNIPCDYLKENLTQINNSIVFLNNCESMPYEEYGMARAFKDNGASTVFGYKQKFAECTSLKEIVFPDNIKVISTSGPYGYYKQYSTMGGCTSLKRAVLPNGLTSIQPYLFYGCSSLTDVEIGPNVTSIGKGAFQDCSSLSTITLPGTVTSIGEDCFSGCTELKAVYCNSITPPAAPGIGIPKSAIIYVPYNSVESYKNHICWCVYTILPMP